MKPKIIVAPIPESDPFQIMISILHVVQPLHDHFQPKKAKKAAVQNLRRKLNKKMKAIIASLAIFTISWANAASVSLTWDANPPEQGVTFYSVYELIGTTWTKLQSTPETTVALQDLAPGPHRYAVTASNATGESGRSNEVTATPATPPANLRVITITLTVQ